MALTVGETDHLVLNRRTVARTGAGDIARIHRRQMQVVADQVMAGRRSAGQVTINLRHRNAVGEGRKRGWRIVAGLHL